MSDQWTPGSATTAALVVTLVVLSGVLLTGSAVATDPGSADTGTGLSATVTTLPTDTPSLLTDTPTTSATPTDASTPTPTPTVAPTATPTPAGPLSTVTNTTENTTETVTNTTENTTETVTNTTENTTEDVTNVTGIVTDVENTTELTGTVTVEANLSVGVGPTATGTPAGGQTGTVSRTGAASTATPGGDESSSTTVADSTGAQSRSTAVAAPPGAGSGGSGPAPSPVGVAVGGLVVGVLTAAASRQVATVAPIAGGQPTYLWQTVQTHLGRASGSLRARLARLPRVLLPFGYSRYDDSDPLEHDVRESLFESVERAPGINLSTLANGADASLSSVRHHLRILEEENLIVGERIRGQRRYFLSTESEPELVAALDDTATEPILRALAASGPASVTELAEKLGRDPSTISHHVSRLEDDGLVERERDGQSVQNSLVPVADRVLTRDAGGASRSVATE